MTILREVGGVRVSGKGSDAWTYPEGRLIVTRPAIFDSDVPAPDIEETSFGTMRFVLPCYRGREEYEIHLLDSGEAVILKDGHVYLCTLLNGSPRVLTYLPVPTDRQVASKR